MSSSSVMVVAPAPLTEQATRCSPIVAPVTVLISEYPIQTITERKTLDEFSE